MPSGPSGRATSPAAARTPAWRIPPPTSLRARRARPMNVASTRRRPSRPGRPSPFDRQNVDRVGRAGEVRAALTPQGDRRRSRTARRRCGAARRGAWAIVGDLARCRPAVSGWPIEWAWVFSMATRPVIGSCDVGRVAERVVDLVEVERPVGPVLGARGRSSRR